MHYSFGKFSLATALINMLFDLTLMNILHCVGTTCNFERNSQCGWKNSARDNVNWNLQAAGTATQGPKIDHSTNSGTGIVVGCRVGRFLE